MSDTSADRPGLEARFQALSDGNRLRILERLRGGERCVCELADELELGQSLLSFHLKTLREAGLVRARRDGRWMHYRLEAEALQHLRSFLERLGKGTTDGSCCGREDEPRHAGVAGGG